LRVAITELPRPLAVRRLVSFAQAVYDGECNVEGVTARRTSGLAGVLEILERGDIPVLIDNRCDLLSTLKDRDAYQFRTVLVDARMTKLTPDLGIGAADLVIGLGPGFIAGENCDAVIETNRGHYLGRAIWDGAAEADTGVPEAFGGQFRERVLRAPRAGTFHPIKQIGDRLLPRELIAEVDGAQLIAPFAGVLRGLLFPGLTVSEGQKVGDLDPRDDPALCAYVSEKSLAIGGGVLEAILSFSNLRDHLWNLQSAI
jgi:xanthine dehydrogenase accessory factor